MVSAAAADLVSVVVADVAMVVVVDEADVATWEAVVVAVRVVDMAVVVVEAEVSAVAAAVGIAVKRHFTTTLSYTIYITTNLDQFAYACFNELTIVRRLAYR